VTTSTTLSLGIASSLIGLLTILIGYWHRKNALVELSTAEGKALNEQMESDAIHPWVARFSPAQAAFNGAGLMVMGTLFVLAGAICLIVHFT
jgi:hypothetical protein